MKKRLRRLIVFAGVLGLVMAVNVGVASADHGGGTEWTCNAGATVDGESCGGPGNQDLIGAATDNAFAPVGNNIADPARANVEADATTPSNFIAAISNNPLCPFHGVAGT